MNDLRFQDSGVSPAKKALRATQRRSFILGVRGLWVNRKFS
jgi:hypothetical protein